MEYIEKAKYEIIMAQKNGENKEILDFLKQYYSDMVKIVLSQNKEFENEKKYKIPKYILNFSYKKDKIVKPYSFIFSDKSKLCQFYNFHQNEDIDVTVSEINEIDPINTSYKIYEEKYDSWKLRN